MTDESVFAAALAIGSPAERAAYLNRVCAGNPALRAEVDALLAAHAASNALDNPPAAVTGGYTPERRAAPDEAVGAVLAGKYKLVELIGAGGMGAVYMAQQTEPVKRLVAVKVIRDGMDTRQVLARFEAERQALALMDHPNIAKVLDAGTTDRGQPFFVMELVKGVPITEFCDARKLSPRERLELFVPVCLAIQHAHQKGVIHRDIKPSNVLVALYDGKPVPKVIDFGVAKAAGQPLTDKTLVTGFGAIVGTPEYMSPEQAELNQLDIDTRSDVFALGVLLYELLTGTTPLDRARLGKAALLEILRFVREEEPPKPSTRISTSNALANIAASRNTDPLKLSKLMRGELDWIVMKALEKDRNRRYESATALAKDVERHLSGDAVEACPPTLGYLLRKSFRKNRAAVLTAGAFTFVLLVAVGVSLAFGLQATRARDAAVRAEENANAERTDAVAARNDAVTARNDAETRRVDAERQRTEAETAKAEETRQRQAADAARVKADTEAAIANALSDFLRRDLLGQANAANRGGAGNPHVTVRQVLQNAINKLEGQFAGQPLVEAAVRQTIAETCIGLEWDIDAREQLEKAVTLREAHQGADHSETIAAKILLADLLQGRAEGKLTGTFNSGGLATGRSGTGLTAEQMKAQFQEAGKLRREIYTALLARLGPRHLDTQFARFELGAYDSSISKDDSEVQLRRLLPRVPLDHPKREFYYLFLASANVRLKKDLAEAETIFTDLIARSTTARGPEHPATLALKLKYVGALREQQTQEKWDRALKVLNEITASVRRQFDGTHTLALEAYTVRHILTAGSDPHTADLPNPDMLLYLKGIVDLVYALGEGQWRKLEAIYGPEHPETIHARARYADLLERGLQQIGRRPHEAARHWKALLAIAYRTHGPDHATTRDYQTKIDTYNQMLERQAQNPYTVAASTLSTLTGPARSKEYLPTILGLIMTNGQYDPLILPTALDVFGPADRVTIACLRYSVDHLMKNQKLDDAENTIRDHLTWLEFAFWDKEDDRSWAIGTSCALLGEVLLERRLFSDARKILTLGWKKLPAEDTENHNRLREARVLLLDRLVRLEEGVGNPAEAAKWRKEYDHLPPERAALPKPRVRAPDPVPPKVPPKFTPKFRLPAAPPPHEPKK